jgi:hypothetical protein
LPVEIDHDDAFNLDEVDFEPWKNIRKFDTFEE